MRRAAVLGLVASAVALASAPLASGATGGPARTSVEIARLVVSTPVRARPSAHSRLVARLAAVRPITRQQTALPVLRRVRSRVGAEWLLVRLPGRSAGGVGWIRSVNANVARSPWRVVVHLGARRAKLYRAGRPVLSVPVVVGKPATPTPRGRFFVVEHVRQPGGSTLGQWVLATSAFSRVLQEFDGGDGQIGLHGRSGGLLRDPLGTAASHGCVRFDNRVIARLSRLLPNGTPIDIV